MFVQFLAIAVATWLREQIWGDLPASVRDHALFGVGQLVGGLAVMFVNPCAAGSAAARLATQAYLLGWAARSGYDAYQAFSNGEYAWGVANTLFAVIGLRGSLSACFVEGTPVEWEQGTKAIETLVRGDRVWARSEHDPDGPQQLLEVEEVFARLGRVWEVTVNGRVIGTTGEHPFAVAGRDWVTVAELRVGDVVRTRDGQPAVVEAVRDTGEYATVYNLRVAAAHTYFLGCVEWGFALWVHNAYGQFREGVVSRGLTNSQTRRAWVLRQAGDMDGFRAYLRARGIRGAELSAVQRAANLPVTRARNLVRPAGQGGGLRAHEGLPTSANVVNHGTSTTAAAHTLATHTGQDVAILRARLTNATWMTDASSFLSRAEAERMVSIAIRREQATIHAFMTSPAAPGVQANRLRLRVCPAARSCVG